MPVLFENDQWEVHDDKLVARTVSDGARCAAPEVEIDACRFLDTTELNGSYYAWPLEAASKPWVDLELFIQAYTIALAMCVENYEGRHDQEMLDASFEAARRETERRET